MFKVCLNEFLAKLNFDTAMCLKLFLIYHISLRNGINVQFVTFLKMKTVYDNTHYVITKFVDYVITKFVELVTLFILLRRAPSELYRRIVHN